MVKIKEIRVMGSFFHVVDGREVRTPEPLRANETIYCDGEFRKPYDYRIGTRITVSVDWSRTWPWENLNYIKVLAPDGTMQRHLISMSGRGTNTYRSFTIDDLGLYELYIGNMSFVFGRVVPLTAKCPNCGTEFSI